MMLYGKRLVVSEKAVRRSKMISEFVEGSLSRKETSLALNMSERQVSRLAIRWKKSGIIGIEHGNAGTPSGRKMQSETRERIESLAREKYRNFNLKHFHEMLLQQEKILVSYSSVKRICIQVGINKRPRRKKKIRKYRNRFACEGLMIQMDGSEHEWTRKKSWVLIAPIDDATSEVAYGEFFETEGLQGYLRVLRKLFKLKGIPRILYVDHAAWLSGTTKQDESGQFKRICDELGITLIFANSPQAKGRVERLWGTFQDRLVAEFDLHQIRTLEQANDYLNLNFLPLQWNSKFTVLPKQPGSRYRRPPTDKGLDEIFCYKYKRKIRNDHTILWNNQLYQIHLDLGYSIAKRELEIRLYADGSMDGYYAGKNLELKVIHRPGDRRKIHTSLDNSPGLKTAPLIEKSMKRALNIYT